MTPVPPDVVRLADRLRTVAGVLPPVAPTDEEPPARGTAEEAGALLDGLVRRAASRHRPDEAWLLLTGVLGVYPHPEWVEEFRRLLRLARDPDEVIPWLLHTAHAVWRDSGHPVRTLRILTGAVLVDVDFSARNNKHTGIQRVTRELARRWVGRPGVQLAVWDDTDSALRAPTVLEAHRVSAWSGPVPSTTADALEAAERPLLVPWRSTVLLPEVPQRTTALPLTALARYSGNTVGCVAYDAIPVTSADLRPDPEPNLFVRYLTLVKYLDRVAGISTSATAEFRGFSQALGAQGLPGPVVTNVPLAAEVPPAPADADPPGERPLLLAVGSREIHKNHLAVLHAAELCWRAGLDFELLLVGGPGWDTSEIDATVERLAAAGRPVSLAGVVTDEQLWALYRRAHCTVFPSLHEGFGLPVAEGLASGTPSITTDYGSTAEIAQRGGCLLVDPRDDHALEAAMTTMLTDADTYRRLKAEAEAAPVRTWDAYAADLWSVLVDGVAP